MTPPRSRKTPEKVEVDTDITVGPASVDVAAETDPPKRRGRQVSPLIKATRDYEDAHKAAVKARQRIAKVRPLMEALDELEKAEGDAWAALLKVQDETRPA